MLLADLHTHTKLCGHASGRVEEYLYQAEKLGLAYYGVADHFPFPPGYDPLSRMNEADYIYYRDSVKRLKVLGKKSGVKVLYGAEIDFVPGRMDEVRKAAEKEDFDFIIGSIHYVWCKGTPPEGFPFDNDDFIAGFDTYGTDCIWEDYAERLCEFVQDFSMDTLGHLDLPKKFGHRHSDPALFLKKLMPALEYAGKKGIALEINTAGLRKKVHELYPSLELLKAAKSCGMPLTFGSDAHSPGDVGADFDRAIELAKAASYRSILVFEKRSPIELPLD